MEEWNGWGAAKRLDFITNLQQDSGLPDPMVSFLHHVAQDKSLDALTRNNASNVLVTQERRDPALAGLFCAMLEDQAEDEQWRDYALQFLAVSLDWCSDQAGMTTAIWRMACSGPGSIPGTALLHLHYIDERGGAPLPTGYRERLVQVLADPNADLANRVTAAGIIGQRDMQEFAPILRKLINDAREPAIRRAALAALGRVGDRTDRELAERFTNDADPLTAVSAHSAMLALSEPVVTDTHPESRATKP